jgi:hypothetical protein
MPAKSGRLEKRIRLAVPVEITSLQYTSAYERTTTENVCSLGIRVLTEHAREQNERLMVRSLSGDLPALARVVYCQRLADGHFGIGLQFQGGAVSNIHRAIQLFASWAISSSFSTRFHLVMLHSSHQPLLLVETLP